MYSSPRPFHSDAFVQTKAGAFRNIPTGRDIMYAACDVCQVPWDEIVSNYRHKRVALARQCVAYVAREATLMSIQDVAVLMRGRKSANSTITTMLNRLACKWCEPFTIMEQTMERGEWAEEVLARAKKYAKEN